MNARRRSLSMVAAAIGIATLACSGLGGAAAQPTPTPAATLTEPATFAPPAASATPAASDATATLTAATASVGEATAADTEAATPEGAATATAGEAIITQAATEAGPTSTYDTVAAQLTVPPLMTALAATATAATGSLRQWATAARASSQYGDTDWSASQATGAPNTPPSCSDETTAWAGASSTDKETLELTYTTTVVPAAVNIYETYGPGSIVKVDVQETNGTAHTVFNGLPLPSPQCPLTLSIGISGVNAHVNKVTIYFDQGLIGNWDEVDAVELVGNP